MRAIDRSIAIGNWLKYSQPEMGNDVYVCRVFSDYGEDYIDRTFTTTDDYINRTYSIS